MSRERMSHREARGLLTELVSDGLEDAVASRVHDHLSECRACREWVATYETLQTAFESDGAREEEEHPSADLLALCVVRPEEVSELDRQDLRRHLDRCVACRMEIETLRTAVHEARPGSAEPARQSSRPAERRRRWVAHPVLLAAGLSALAFGLGGLYLARIAGTGTEHQAYDARVASVSPAEPERVEAGTQDHLSDVELEDARLIEADHGLLVTHVKVKPGARVTFRAGGTAAFGDGFQISDGGSIVVEAGGRRSPVRNPGDSS